jgi:hypothetical protein
VRFARTDGTLTQSINALIDTESGQTGFPWGWLSELGINQDCCDPISGHTMGDPDSDSGSVVARWAPGLDAEVAGRWTIHLDATFHPVIDRPVLLGRDFLAHFRVSIDRRNKRFWLEPYA